MVFLGFGLLLTFVVKYSYSSFTYVLLFGGFCLQWCLLLFGFFDLFTDIYNGVNVPSGTSIYFKISIYTLIKSIYGSTAFVIRYLII
jgi:hypothetical protein